MKKVQEFCFQKCHVIIYGYVGTVKKRQAQRLFKITGDALFQNIETTGRFFHVGAVVITQCLVNGIFCGLLKSVLISLSICKTVKSVETISDLILIICLVLMKMDSFVNTESFFLILAFPLYTIQL